VGACRNAEGQSSPSVPRQPTMASRTVSRPASTRPKRQRRHGTIATHHDAILGGALPRSSARRCNGMQCDRTCGAAAGTGRCRRERRLCRRDCIRREHHHVGKRRVDAASHRARHTRRRWRRGRVRLRESAMQATGRPVLWRDRRQLRRAHHLQRAMSIGLALREEPMRRGTELHARQLPGDGRSILRNDR
jgi:hypothetical protein